MGLRVESTLYIIFLVSVVGVMVVCGWDLGMGKGEEALKFSWYWVRRWLGLLRLVNLNLDTDGVGMATWGRRNLVGL